MEYTCDINLILRYVLADDPTMFVKAVTIFNKEKKGQITVVIEKNVFTEMLHILSANSTISTK